LPSAPTDRTLDYAKCRDELKGIEPGEVVLAIEKLEGFHGEVRVIPGVWGHFAGSGDSPVDLEYIDGVLKELLATAAGP
jgi:hypothetical protein